MASRFISIVGMLGLILGLGAAVPRTARAEIQNDLIGFSPNHVFESGEAGENIDVLSGNLTLTIPIGPRIKLSDNFSYGVTLYYNSKIWEHECPQGYGTSQPCPGTLPANDRVGLGFSILPGRVYHHADDKKYVFRLQLEDGSEHFFCDPTAPDYTTDTKSAECVVEVYTPYTNDIAHIRVVHYDTPETPSKQGWKATMPDGRIITFGKVLNTATHEALATKVEGLTPADVVDYTYAGAAYELTDITDSQGRVTHITYGLTTYPYNAMDVAIDVPGFAGQEALANTTKARYILRRGSLSFSDPSDGVNGLRSAFSLKEIIFPAPLNVTTETYKFEYSRTGEPKAYGWLLQRKLPTGATVDYFYDSYRTSTFRPYHTELIAKTVTTGGVPYRWTWKRFKNDQSLSNGQTFLGSNPYQVNVLDPFGNLTRYAFWYSIYDTGNQNSCNATGECINRWSDGLLDAVSTYVGPEPDSERLVRHVEYKWDSERNTTTQAHEMFQYRLPTTAGTTLPVHSMAVNVRQVEEITTVPASGSGPGHTVKVKHSDWFELCPRQTDEYLDDVFYRSTHTEASGSGCPYPTYSEVTDALGNVVSRVDRVYAYGKVLCEVRRNGPGPFTALTNCNSALTPSGGDVATVNNLDSVTRVTTSTTVRGGDDAAIAARTATMTYLDPATGGSTGFLKTKNVVAGWNAVNREVDFNTGSTFKNYDPVGNTMRYSWDALGRLTRIEPTLPETPTTITYTSVRETRVLQELTSSNYLESVYLYDDLGRLVTTKRRNAGNTFDVQKTEYDIAGRVTRKSEWATDDNFKWTVYDYTMYVDSDALPGTVSRHADPLGRVHSVTTPDDPTPQTPTTETAYSGNMTTVTVRDIRGWVTNADTSVTSTTTYTKDALGRLIAVDSPGTGADAQYIYDESDNLTEVRLTDPTDPTRVQVRRFDYDRLGRPRTASNPESGTVEYLSYDARGNLLSYKDARQNIFKMTYDNADRLLTRSQKVGNSCLLLAENTYDTGAGFSAGGSSGHLVQQDSYKIDGTSSVLVSRVRFGYGTANSSPVCGVSGGAYTGLNGRLSWQKSSIQPWGVDLQTDYCQDALGLPTTVSYPDIANSGRTRSKVGTSYLNGYVKQLGDAGRRRPYVASVLYAAGGIPTKIDRGSSTDFLDVDLRKRPASFRVIGHAYVVPSICGSGGSCFAAGTPQGPYPSLADNPPAGGGDVGGVGDPDGDPGPPPPAPVYANWSSGAYAYDMGGNVKSIGAEQYYYDELSRLVHGTVPVYGATQLLNFQFDAFGNMTLLSRMESNYTPSLLTRTYGTDWRTNRLTQKVVNGASPVGYTYDENGNMTAEGGRGFVFDGEGRLREVMDPEKGRIGNYDYDASGYRVRVESDGTETFLFRDATGQVLSEFQRPLGDTATPTWNKDYVYALGKVIALAKNQAPATPNRPWATGVGSTGLTLNWAALSVPDMLAYSIERRYKASANASETLLTYTLPASTTTWVDSYPTAVAATYLKYTLTAMDTAGNLSKSGPQLVVYPGITTPPAAPTDVTATAGDQAITIRWTPVPSPNNDLGGYYVERQNVAAGPFVRLNDFLLTAPKFIDTGLVNGQTYSYVVRAVDTSGRTSSASAVVSTAPVDNIPPGKLTDVFGEPDRVAGRVVISWSRGLDLDVASYGVYRSSTAGTLGSQVTSKDVVSGQENYSATDPGATQGAVYYYSVIPVDTSGNASTTADQVSVRPRHTGVSAPVFGSAVFNVDDRQTTSDIGDGFAEDDDVIQVIATWQPAAGTSGDAANSVSYRLYRQGADELHAKLVATVGHVQSQSSYTYKDTTVTKGNYTYYVVAWKSIGTWEESPASPSSAGAAGTADHPVRPFNATVSVRKLYVMDSRNSYTTENRASRSATVTWSRVTEPELVGYNVYRMCSWSSLAPFDDAMDHFACEPVWIRLNTAPIAPSQRSFEDSTTGGLQGEFYYAVRPVGPNRVEGPIAKIVYAGLVFYSNDIGPFYATVATTLFRIRPQSYPPAEYPWHWVKPVSYFLDPPNGINAIAHGTADPSGPPQAPTGVMRYINVKDLGDELDITNPDPYAVPSHAKTQYADITWTMGAPPSDLIGFHVETAGSRNGPWKRLTERPVAWWERRYIAQGIGLIHGPDAGSSPEFSGHAECVSYRVIAVDETGNESLPADADNNPSATACPQTLDPPKNLRASTYSVKTASELCKVQLQWDAPTGATASTEYYVYRFRILSVPWYFYDTQRVIGETSYLEIGLDQHETRPPGWENIYWPDWYCPMYDGGHPCDTAYLDAYYVTARTGTGGETPRSNLVFWKCGVGNGTGYAKLLPPADSTDAIASIDVQRATEPLACWLSDGPAADVLSMASNETGAAHSSPELATSPMLSLGSTNDPAWIILELHTDHLGSVRAITDINGALVSAHNYYPFGDEITQFLSYNTHQYTGHERDKETGLDYMLARYYGESLPRFLSPDSLDGTAADPQSWNRYTYVRNNPLGLVDRTGQKDVSAIDEATKIAIEAGARSTAGYLARRFLGPVIETPGLDFLFTANEAANSFQELATITTAHAIEKTLSDGFEDADNDAGKGFDEIRKIVLMFEVDPGRAKQMLDLFLRETNKEILKSKRQKKDPKTSSSSKKRKTGTDPDKSCADCLPGNNVAGAAWVQDGQIHRGAN